MQNLDLVEDVVQDAFVKALQTWTFADVPENPGAWLMQVARRRAIDVLRRDSRGMEIVNSVATLDSVEVRVDECFHPNEISDNQLRLMFACCHPLLKKSDQIALTLKTAGGFGIREISRALLISTDTVKQRLFRARERIKRHGVEMSIPVGAELSPRLDAVHTVLYLLFNEGYSPSESDDVIRRDLCAESMRLMRILCEHPIAAVSSSNALMALMCFHAARFDARVSLEGQAVLLTGQDRSKWDTKLLNVGQYFMKKAMGSGPLTVYHLEAMIAAQHVWSKNEEETDWPRMRKLYEVLYEVKPSPVVRLNLLVVLIKQGDLKEGERVIAELKMHPGMGKNHLFEAVQAEFYKASGLHTDALISLQNAIEYASSGTDRNLLVKRLESWQSMQ